MTTNLNAEMIRSLFDQVYVINLPERTDRRTEIAGQLEKIGLSLSDPLVCLFPAVRPDEKGAFPSVGAAGCFMSHLQIIERAVSDGHNSILILEDDMDWTPSALDPDSTIAKELGSRDWKFLHGGLGNDANGHKSPFSLKKLVPGEDLRLTHFIGLRGHAISAARRYLADMLERPAGSPDGGPMHVDGAYSWLRKDHKDIESYVCVPSIAMQRPSLSDITPHTGLKATPILRNLLNVARKIRKSVR